MKKLYYIVFYGAHIYSMQYPAQCWHHVIQTILGIIKPSIRHVPITVTCTNPSKTITLSSLNGPVISIKITKKNSDGTYSIPVHINNLNPIFTPNIAQLQKLYNGDSLRVCHGRTIFTICLIPTSDSPYYELRAITRDYF